MNHPDRALNPRRPRGEIDRGPLIPCERSVGAIAYPSSCRRLPLACRSTPSLIGVVLAVISLRVRRHRSRRRDWSRRPRARSPADARRTHSAPQAAQTHRVHPRNWAAASPPVRRSTIAPVFV